MLKFSFGGPKKLLKRYASIPLISDFQMLLSHATEQTGREFGIGWVHEGEQYRIFVRHENGQVLWRLFEGDDVEPLWSSNQTNLAALHSEVVMRCKGAPPNQKLIVRSPLETTYAGINLASIVSRQKARLEDGALEQLMQGPLAIKRTYLATTDPIEVKKLIERVGLPVDQVMSALKELIASGLLQLSERTERIAPPDTEQLTWHQEFNEAVKARPNTFETSWSKALATPPEVLQSSGQNSMMNEARMHSMSVTLMDSLQALVKQYAAIFNANAVDKELHIIVTDLGQVTERVPNPNRRGTSEVKLMRWRASTSTWTLSARARVGTIELFLISAADAFTLGTAEHELQALAKWEIGRYGNELLWLSDGLPVAPEEIRATIRSCLRELIRTTVNELVRDEQLDARALPESIAQLHARQTLLEKQNLAQKIVSQQEEIQRRIARDLHDAVIADVTLLKRSVAAEPPVGRDKVISSLDQVIARLREICYDLSPSDLKDWGLQTTLEALLDHIAQRMGAEPNLVCDLDIPNMDTSVELHIFRILQEALNNCAKYSNATEVTVHVKRQNSWLIFTVTDNGQGFDSADSSARTKDGGMGMSSMQERVELIRTLYPARLQVISQPGRGTTTVLSVKIPS